MLIGGKAGILGAIQNFQHLIEYTKHTLSHNPLPLKKCTHQHFSNE